MVRCAPAVPFLRGWRLRLALATASAQRLYPLAAATLQHTELLLLDEPTDGLDAGETDWVREYITGLKDVTCVIVSRDMCMLDCCTNVCHVIARDAVLETHE
eukprot:gene58197-biopygen3348